jgi:D-sedoheptulose 7-phosphate isomerase
MNNWLNDYKQEFNGAFENFLEQDIEKTCQLITRKLMETNVFIIGNGGSAAIAQHFATDWTKGIYAFTRKRSRALSLTTNSSIITATANDLKLYGILFKPT